MSANLTKFSVAATQRRGLHIMHLYADGANEWN